MNFEPDVIWTLLLSDLVIVLSYFSIPFALVYLVRRRRDLEFNWMFLLFALFIVLCGTTHIFGVLALWVPFYRLDGLVKFATALASASTSLLLWRLMPQLLAIPSPGQLRLINQKLADEIAERKQAEEKIQRLNANLEELVRIRTAELESLITSAPLGLAFFDREHRYLRINDVLAAINGIAPKDHIGRTVAELLPVNAQLVDPVIDEVLQTGQAVGNLEVAGETPAQPGIRRYWLTGFFPVQNPTGSVESVGVWVTDISERKRAEIELRHAEERFQIALRKAPVILFTHDKELRYTWLHNSIAPFSTDHAIGRTDTEIASSEDARTLVAVKARVLNTGKGERCEVKIHPQGAPRYYDLTLEPIIGPDGAVQGIACAAIDITGLKQAEGALLEADRRKDATSEVREMMDRQLSHMVRLIDDLLDISRVTSGKVVLRKERVTLQSAVAHAVEANRPLIDSSRNALSLILPEEPIWVYADLTRLSQIVTNLLTNAAKYTPEGGRITLEVGQTDLDAFVRVTDTGLGIPRDMLHQVFEMFTQGNRDLDRAQGGLGIGLALVKRLTEMHDGSITAHSEGPGRGSTFTVTLPALGAEPARKPDAQQTRPNKAEARRQLRVLIVDDNKDGADSLALLLGIVGHDTRTVYSGPDAITIAQEFSPDVIFLDIGLPGMSGHEVARRIRATPDLQRTTLVAVTGWGTEEDKRKSRDAGFDLHLTKPVESSAVDDVIARCLAESPTVAA